MRRKDETDTQQDRPESLPFESGWSEAEFSSLERRWSFLTRIGKRKAEGDSRVVDRFPSVPPGFARNSTVCLCGIRPREV
jgi:hypothetical protein